jgi:hypothetical protein
MEMEPDQARMQANLDDFMLEELAGVDVEEQDANLASLSTLFPQVANDEPGPGSRPFPLSCPTTCRQFP